MKRLSFILNVLLLLLLPMATGCSGREAEVPEPAHAMYYWRSELLLTSHEREVLRRQEVGKLYLHLFDVVRRAGQMQPNATITITDTLPQEVRVIPVVFLAHDLLQDTTGLAQLPRLLARRVKQIMLQNGMPAPDELQIDFDWTKRNQERYFSLLRDLREALANEGIGRLSTTIRLHQLALKEPPVDYGALMVYNTGNYADPKERCSILTPQHLKPYMRYLPKYPLPLCAALPLFSWDLLFHRGQFECIVRGIDLQDTARFETTDGLHYRSLSLQAIPPSGVTMNGKGRILPGDVIRHEWVPAATLDSVRQMLDEVRPSLCRQTILYHLDENQMNNYSYEELHALYTGH